MKTAINFLNNSKKEEMNKKEKFKGIWEMSDYNLKSPIIKGKRASISQTSFNGQIFHRKNCRTSIDFLPKLAESTKNFKSGDNQNLMASAINESSSSKPIEYRNFSRESKNRKRERHAATSMSMTHMNPLASSNEN